MVKGWRSVNSSIFERMGRKSLVCSKRRGFWVVSFMSELLMLVEEMSLATRGRDMDHSQICTLIGRLGVKLGGCATFRASYIFESCTKEDACSVQRPRNKYSFCGSESLDRAESTTRITMCLECGMLYVMYNLERTHSTSAGPCLGNTPEIARRHGSSSSTWKTICTL